MKILIIGGTGSLGKKLIEKYLPENEICIYSRDEAKQWTIRNELMNNEYRSFVDSQSITFHVGDVRDKSRLVSVMKSERPDVVIMAAALKQVDTCEKTPYESIQTNIFGVNNTVDAFEEVLGNTKSTYLFVSTDKACSPINVYGMCKALAERIVTSKRSNTARYIAVRYGNVLESRGSIIPLFKYQAQKHGKITVTNYDMTRFIMTLDDSVQLIDYAIKHLESGQICIPKLRSMKIGDLARIFSEHYNVPTHFIGERPGEKKHEDLINVPESARTIFDGNYFIVDSIWSGTSRTPFVNAYSSFNLESMLSQESLRSYLESLGVLSKSLDEFSGLKIEEINTANAK